MKKMFLLVLFILVSGALAYGAQKSRIELTDGSTLEGEVVSFSEGNYIVKSPTLGILKVEKEKVRDIRGADQPAKLPKSGSVVKTPSVAKTNGAAGDVSYDPEEVQKLQNAMTSNAEVMGALLGLLATPEFQDLMKDPEILNAAKTVDMKKLMKNPKIVKATQNPQVQEIGQKLKEKHG